MMMLRSFLVFCLLFILASCGENATEPAKNNDNPEKPIDSTGFAIISSSRDTLYYGEEAWIQVNDLGTNVDDLRLFVHTVEVSEMTIEGDRLVFEVPRNASSGKLRLYKDDTLLAKNDFVLNVLPHHINEFQTTPLFFSPGVGYPGETFFIRVFDLPMRRSEFDVILDNQKLKILEWDTSTIVVEIPEDERVGTLQLRAFKNLFTLGQFRVLEHGGVLFSERTITSVSVNGSQLLGQTRVEFQETDSALTFASTGINVGSWLSFEQAASVTIQDSIRVNNLEEHPIGDRTLHMSLKPGTNKNTVSGRISMTEITDKNGENETIVKTSLLLKDVSWMIDSGGYVFYAYGEHVTNKLIAIEHEIAQSNGRFRQKTVNYTGGSKDAMLVISIKP